MRNILELVSQSSVNLQNRKIKLSTVTRLSKATISSLTYLRRDESFNKLWIEVEEVAEEEGCIIPSL
jgi:hypothetical protein